MSSLDSGWSSTNCGGRSGFFPLDEDDPLREDVDCDDVGRAPLPPPSGGELAKIVDVEPVTDPPEETGAEVLSKAIPSFLFRIGWLLDAWVLEAARTRVPVVMPPDWVGQPVSLSLSTRDGASEETTYTGWDPARCLALGCVQTSLREGSQGRSQTPPREKDALSLSPALTWMRFFPSVCVTSGCSFGVVNV